MVGSPMSADSKSMQPWRDAVAAATIDEHFDRRVYWLELGLSALGHTAWWRETGHLVLTIFHAPARAAAPDGAGTLPGDGVRKDPRLRRDDRAALHAATAPAFESAV
jgi:hypothetical protein